MVSVWLSPLFAVIPTFALVTVFVFKKRAPLFVASLLWMAYCAWEAMLKWGGWCDEECNIRVDLIPLLPALTVASAIAVVPFWEWFRLSRETA